MRLSCLSGTKPVVSVFMMKLQFIGKKLIPCHFGDSDGHLIVLYMKGCFNFTHGFKYLSHYTSNMCSKSNVVKRIYVIMMTKTLSIESRCIGVMRRPPTEKDIEELTKKHVSDPLVPSKLEKVYTVPVDVPIVYMY